METILSSCHSQKDDANQATFARFFLLAAWEFRRTEEPVSVFLAARLVRSLGARAATSTLSGASRHGELSSF